MKTISATVATSTLLDSTSSALRPTARSGSARRSVSTPLSLSSLNCSNPSSCSSVVLDGNGG